MKIDQLQAQRFRNLSPFIWKPSPGVNIIYGENAQGKTNLLEAIWLFSGLKSFRGSRDTEMIRFGETAARLDMEFTSKGRQHKAELHFERNRRAVINGVSAASPVKLAEYFSESVFSPSFMSLVQSGPMERRNFLDGAICQLKPAYAALLTEYGRTVKHRNSLLGDVEEHSELLDVLDVWDEKLVEEARKIVRCREYYLSLLLPAAQQIYNGLSGGKEKLELVYIKRQYEGVDDTYAAALRQNRKRDILTRNTNIGPHRDDVGIYINAVTARVYGSQGQQRSCAIALKLAEAEIIRDRIGEQPVILLDDVMSELDTGRQDYILNHLGDKQVFITCCDPSQILRMCGGSTVYMDNGKLSRG